MLPIEYYQTFFVILFVSVMISVVTCQHDPDIMSTKNRYDPEAPENKFGLLHTLDGYASWAAYEEEIVEVLTERLKLLDAERQLIQSYLSDYNDSSGEALRNLVKPLKTAQERGEVIGASAVLGHRMTRRYNVQILQLANLLRSWEYRSNNDKVFRSLIHLYANYDRYKPNNPWPWVNWEDMYMSMTAFLHISDIYSFGPTDLTDGMDLESTYGGKLHPVHGAELAMFGLHRRKYYAAIEWLEHMISVLESDAEERAITTEVDSTLLKSLLRLSIQEHNRQMYVFAMDENEHKMGDYERYFNFYMDPLKASEQPQDRVRYRQDNYWTYKGLEPHSHADAQFMDLCLGSNVQTPEMQKTLKCHYEQHIHPYLYINPVKVEQLSESPPVFQLYEMIGNKTGEMIVKSQRPLVKISQLVGTSGIDSITVFRTSAGVGMGPDLSPEMIYNLAEDVTGLKIMGTSEYIQFAEYTYGRYYDYHIDAFDQEDEEEVQNGGDRLATVLYYLEVPEMGGLTPFCDAGISAYPVKGSAVFWYNMYRNGTARTDTNHGACPVLHGNKIIMNHWIRYNGNWNHCKCSLNQLE